MRLKAGVRLHGLQPQLVLAAMIAEPLWRELGAPELVITSGTDSTHSGRSCHYAGAALDFRTSNLPGGNADAGKAATELQFRLSSDYQVIAEADHVHVEWQPRSPEVHA